MLLELTRRISNPLFTEGMLSYRGKCLTMTIEATDIMLPPGIYRLFLHPSEDGSFTIHLYEGIDGPLPDDYPNPRNKRMPLIDTDHTLGVGHSFRTSYQHHRIIIGTPLIPGVLFRARPQYDQLVELIRPLTTAGQAVLLNIREDLLTHTSTPPLLAEGQCAIP